MLRSLLIGFLILSALTTNGAEAQMLKSDLSISADMLLEFFNSVSVKSSKAAELSTAKTGRASFAHASFDNNQFKPKITRLRHTRPIAWLGQREQTDRSVEDRTVFQRPVHSITLQAFYCVSGLSPPMSEA